MEVRVLQTGDEPTNWINDVKKIEFHDGELLLFVGDAKKVSRFEGGRILQAKE